METKAQTTTNCVACGNNLPPGLAGEMGDLDNDYQFDNALWIGFHGGYGMFVDNTDATMQSNPDDMYLRDEDGEYLIAEGGGLIPNPEYMPEFREPRLLPGQPDYEAVICHDCAHDLCKRVPWIEKLLNPHGSHAHSIRKDWTGHTGWDLPHARR